MNTKKRLTTRDKEFFTLVSQAAFTNPFSEKRAQIDSAIAGEPKSGVVYDSLTFIQFMPRLTRRIEKLESDGFHRIQDFASDDRHYVKYVYLFFIFHKYVADLDSLILAQLEHGETPVQAPFARNLLKDMSERGLNKEEALRYIALFYQLRRAFYFIVKGLVGRSLPMKKLRLALWNNVFTHDTMIYDQHLWNRMEDFSTLLLGETGTGKGAAASAIGRSGYIPFNEKKNCFEVSFTSSFLSINLSQYPESLIESELFGHRKGAFTGAIENHEGIFSRSSQHGALFLDEIGEVSAPVQIKLLQVIQDRIFSPVGGHAMKRFQGRIIAATNKPMDKLRGEGLFRDDFFYRLSSDVIVVPPLRLRIAEDPVELDELISLVVHRILGNDDPHIASIVREAIDANLPEDYAWPGNVRELEQAVRRIILTSVYTGEEPAGGSDPMTELIRGIEKGSLDAKELMSCYCALLYQRVSSYEEVARKTNLDRRTAKKYIEQKLKSD